MFRRCFSMKNFRYLIFISILSSVFVGLYRQSEKTGFRRFWTSFKGATVIAAILAGLLPNPAPMEASENRPSTSIERLVGTPRCGFKPDPNQSQPTKQIVSLISEDPGLVRAAEEACNNQKVQENINNLQDELAKGNDNP